MNEKKEQDDTEEKSHNFIKVIEEFANWVDRFEKKGLTFGEQDWVNWAIDITSAIIDLYHYLKSLGILYKGASDLLYEPLSEDSEAFEKLKSMYM